MDALLTQVLDCVRHPVTVRWVESTLTPAQDAVLERECAGPSDFDQIESRKTFHAHYKAGRIRPLVRTCFVGEDLVGTVVALLSEVTEAQDIPWDLWGKILALFKNKKHNSPYTVYFCAHPASRQFPEHSRITQPLHINGGYTYPCSHEAIVIYRAEDATRVLIHELFHAACSDNPNQGLEQREAETEAWAELFWCAFMACASLGDLKSLKSCVQKQANWIVSQNRRLTDGNHYEEGVNGFPWRYTTGKELLWKRWNLMDHAVPHPIDSMRLTFKPTAAMKKMYGVRPTSTFL